MLERAQVSRLVHSALGELGRPVPKDSPADAPLDLESIEVVMLHDLLEQALDTRIAAALVTAEAFTSVESLVAMIDGLKDSP